MSESACVRVDVYICTVYSIPSLLTSLLTDSSQKVGASVTLSQKVYGELVILMSLVSNVSVKHFLTLQTDVAISCSSESM